MPISGDLNVELAQDLLSFPIWAFHGERDELVSNANTRAMFAMMQRLGGITKYTEFAGVGHDAWQQAFARPDLFDWLFAQRR